MSVDKRPYCIKTVYWLSGCRRSGHRYRPVFRTTGIITEASQGQSDGSLTIYNLTLKDPTALWHKRRNSRVFMNKSVRDISEILFKEWQEKSPYLPQA